jgi:nitrite reductase/ring-hydroxylating ferredoxin subunit
MTTKTAETDVGPVTDFQAGKFKIVEIDGEEIGVVKLANGEFRAVRNRCPHKGAKICAGPIAGTWPPSEPNTLQYDRDGEVLVCPWHGLEYDLNTGREMFETGNTKLRMFPVAVTNGRVLVSLR